MNPEKKTCRFCGRAIRAYKVWKDWEKRDAHYACHRAWMEQKRFEMHLADYGFKPMPSSEECPTSSSP